MKSNSKYIETVKDIILTNYKLFRVPEKTKYNQDCFYDSENRPLEIFIDIPVPQHIYIPCTSNVCTIQKTEPLEKQGVIISANFDCVKIPHKKDEDYLEFRDRIIFDDGLDDQFFVLNINLTTVLCKTCFNEIIKAILKSKEFQGEFECQ